MMPRSMTGVKIPLRMDFESGCVNSARGQTILSVRILDRRGAYTFSLARLG